MSIEGSADRWPSDPRERLVKLSHDLRSPLVVVKGFAELLVTRTELPEEQRAEFLGRVLTAAREIEEILDAERASRPLEL